MVLFKCYAWWRNFIEHEEGIRQPIRRTIPTRYFQIMTNYNTIMVQLNATESLQGVNITLEQVEDLGSATAVPLIIAAHSCKELHIRSFNIQFINMLNSISRLIELGFTVFFCSTSSLHECRRGSGVSLNFSNTMVSDQE